MAKPKLALIPAAQGSKLYSVLPSSGVGDFDFTRSGSATRINSQGLIETVASGVSRLNYPLIDGVVKGCPSHLLEPSRTNFMPYSNGFDNVAWEKGSGGVAPAPIVSANQGISPDGTNNAFKVELNLNGGTTPSDRSRLTDNFTGATSTDYTFSFYAKAYSSSEVGKVLKFAVDNSTGDALFTLTSEWKRFVFVGTSTDTNINQHIQLRGNESTSDSVTMLLYGYQAEQGSYPTSYIPTNGSATTRSAETANGSGDASTFNSEQGVLMLEASALANDLNIEAISINANNADNRLALFKWNVSNRIQIRVNIAGNTLIDAGVSVSNIEDLNKISLKYKSGDYALWINGFEVYVNSLADTPIGLSNLSFDSNGSNGVPFKGKTKQIQYFDTALTDSELEQLTSWVSFQEMAESQLYSIE